MYFAHNVTRNPKMASLPPDQMEKGSIDQGQLLATTLSEASPMQGLPVDKQWNK